MIIFKWPLMLLLLGAIFWFWRRVKRTQKYSAVFFPEGKNISRFHGVGWRAKLFSSLPLFRLAALILLVIALARPEIVKKEEYQKKGIDIVLALDISGSMRAEDFFAFGQRLNRLDVVKQVIKEFVNKRKNDRIGIVVFGERAFLISPPTLDRDWLLKNLERVEIGMAGDSTAIGLGIVSAINRLRNSSVPSRVIILLTDGRNNAGNISPLTAAKAAADLGIRIYTIGVGKKGPVPYPVEDIFGRKIYRYVQLDLDENGLKKIAQLTGGKYFLAEDTKALKETYEEIDQMEKARIKEKNYLQVKELFPWFIQLGLIFLLLEQIIENTVAFKIP